ncbi:hypothetical protein Ddc_10767 [Ditylenchus destructor]|nr:hypothetical protein Ddc_10767 [Ditylenchus destructor]
MVPSAPLFGSLFQRLKVALSVPTRGLRPLERWLCQCQLAAFGRSNGGFVSANSRPSAARTLALSVPTRGLRPLERWLCQCQLAAFGRSNGGFVSANSRPSAARTVALSVPTRGLRPLEWWLCQCQAWVLPTFLRYRNLADRCAVCWSFVGPRGASRSSHPQTTNTLHTYLPSSQALVRESI